MEAPGASELFCETADGLATIVLNRPDKLNAWTPGMATGLRRMIGEAGADPSVRAIILTGAGRGFCAGADVGNLARAAGGDATVLPQAADPDRPRGDFEQRYSYLLACPKPIVAAINGAAAGVGFILTLYCDLRYIAEDARLTAIFPRRGLIAEHGAAWLLPRMVGTMASLDILLSGRTIDADEAQALGLARKAPAEGFLDHVRSETDRLVSRSSPRSMAVIKRQVYRGWMQSLGEAVEDADREQMLSLASEDFREGIAHFIERREPRFTGR